MGEGGREEASKEIRMRHAEMKDGTRGKNRLEEKEPIVESESTGGTRYRTAQLIGEIEGKVGRP